MSKSNPDSAIFMDDPPEEIQRKINKAYCPERAIEENPIMEYCKYLLFPQNQQEKNRKNSKENEALTITRPAKYGGNLELRSYEELAKTFGEDQLHPMDLKKAVAERLTRLLEPIQQQLNKGRPAKLKEQVASFTVTR